LIAGRDDVEAYWPRPAVLPSPRRWQVQLPVRLLRPTAAVSLLQEGLRHRLEGWSPGGGVLEASLVVEEALVPAGQRRLGEKPRSGEQLGSVLARLTARLGEDRVGCLVRLPDPVPERSQRLVAADAGLLEPGVLGSVAEDARPAIDGPTSEALIRPIDENARDAGAGAPRAKEEVMGDSLPVRMASELSVDAAPSPLPLRGIDAAGRRSAAGATPGTDEASCGLETMTPLPLRLWPPEPVRLSWDAAGAPERLWWRGRTHVVLVSSGVVRLSTRWWEGPVMRDYRTVLLQEGARLWLFRDAQDAYWVQGVFD